MSAIRIMCEVTGESIRPLETERVDMTVQAGDEWPELTEVVGTWIELRDSTKKVLYKVHISDPSSRYVEIVSSPDEKEAPLRAEMIDKASGLFVIAVPDLPGADHVAVMRGAVDDQGTKVVRTEVVSVQLS